MEIWLDTCDIKAIDSASHFGFIYGITTNPTILANAHSNYEHAIGELLEIQDGPIAVQVTAENAEDMIKQALALHTFSDRIIVKIPVIKQGLIAMKSLSDEGVSIMATTIYQPNQALLAALAGADYAAPYVSRMSDAGVDIYPALQMIMSAYKYYGFKTKILAASLRTTDQITLCASMGIHAITLKTSLFAEFTADDPITLDCLNGFSEDWSARSHQKEATTLSL